MTNNKKYDLEERTAKFAERVIKLCKKIPITPINESTIRQLIKASTSVGANYCEADDAESAKDFKHKIGICKKESRESKFWLRMFSVIEPKHKEEIIDLWRESKELNLIFNSIFKKTRSKLAMKL